MRVMPSARFSRYDVKTVRLIQGFFLYEMHKQQTDTGNAVSVFLEVCYETENSRKCKNTQIQRLARQID